MTFQITLGAARGEHTLAADTLCIPALDTVPRLAHALAETQQALREVAERRTGLLIIGPNYCGKSTAVERAVRLLRDDEQQLAVAMPEHYRERRFLCVHGLESKTAREFLMALLQVVSPGLRDRQHGSRKSDDTLRGELVTALLNKHYAAIICDEAEYLTDRIIDQLRKIMADATEKDARRVTVINGKEAYAAAGVGVLLVGTQKLLETVRRSEDAGLRWSDVRSLEYLAPQEVADVYLALCPRFAEHATAIGADAWREFCESRVAMGQPMAIGAITSHARRYFSLLLDQALQDGGALRTLDEAPFVQEAFVYALTKTSWGKDAARRGGK